MVEMITDITAIRSCRILSFRRSRDGSPSKVKRARARGRRTSTSADALRTEHDFFDSESRSSACSAMVSSADSLAWRRVIDFISTPHRVDAARVVQEALYSPRAQFALSRSQAIPARWAPHCRCRTPIAGRAAACVRDLGFSGGRLGRRTRVTSTRKQFRTIVRAATDLSVLVRHRRSLGRTVPSI